MKFDTDKPASQSEIARLVGKTPQAISRLASKCGNVPGMTNGQLLSSIFSRISEEAAGRSGTHQADLTLARIRESNASAELKEIQIKERAGQLIFAEDIEPLLTAMVTAARTELLLLPEKIVSDAKAMNGVELDESVIMERVSEILERLSSSAQAAFN